MSTHDDDTCPHLVVLGRLEAENARLKDQVNYWQIEAKTANARWLSVLEENDALRKKGSQS